MARAIPSPTSTNWGTPKWLFKFAEDYFKVKFDLDICAAPDWTMCDKYLTEAQDALNPDIVWDFTNGWVNPPYGNFIPKILRRVINELKETENKSIVLLLPAKTEVKWLHEQVNTLAEEALLLKRRVSFNVPEEVFAKALLEGKEVSNGGTFGSILVKFTSESSKRTKDSAEKCRFVCVDPEKALS